MVRHRERSGRIYALSKGKTEQNRLAGQHWLFFAATGANYFAPLSRGPRTILDVGCGPGIWMFEIARRFKQARIYGFDTDKASFERQVTRHFKSGLPHRFNFEVASALAPFPYEDKQFDFTHSRCLSPFVPIGRWPQIIDQMVRVTQPGGYVESVETLFPVSESSRYRFFVEAGLALASKLNVYMALREPHQQANFLQAAGLEKAFE